MSRPAVTALERAAEAKLSEQMVEGRVRALAAAFAFAPRTDAPWQAHAHAVKIGVELGRELLELHEQGRIGRESIDALFDALEDGAQRMVELMPPDVRA